MTELETNREVLAFHESYTDEQYDNEKCLSYSIIKDVHYNPDILTQEREPSEKEWLVFGTLVDLMLTQEGDIYDKVLVNDTVPTDQYKKMADYIIDKQLNVNKLTDEQIEEVYTLSGSKVNWTAPVKKAKLLENCIEYISLLTTHANKLIVNTDLFNEATNMAQTFMTHKYTKDLFMSKKEQEENHIEILYQYKIKYVYRGLQFKSKIDIVVIDHDAETISLYDIKTGTDYPRAFARSALYKYKYCYQAALYNEGFKVFKNKIPNIAKYEVDNFRFVYISRLKPTYPLILQVSHSLHTEVVRIGIETPLYYLPSLEDLCAETEYYLEKIDSGDLHPNPMELEQNLGELIITPESRDVF